MTQPLRRPQKIVIVEDNFPLSDIYKTRLEILGYQVFAAYDGIQALAVIERELPDLVLLDLMVPKKAGDQILEEMRNSDWGKNIKVLVISNLNEAEAPAGLRNLGIEAYAVKANLSNDQLDQLVDAILKPANQVEDVVLANQGGTPQIAPAPPEIQNQPIPESNPFSGMSKPVAQTHAMPSEAVPESALATDQPSLDPSSTTAPMLPQDPAEIPPPSDYRP